MERKIFVYLESRPDFQARTLDIAKAVGCVVKKDVNPVLYSLEKQRLLLRVSTAPPIWKLVHPPPSVGSAGRNTDYSSNSKTSTPPNSQSSQTTNNLHNVVTIKTFPSRPVSVHGMVALERCEMLRDTIKYKLTQALDLQLASRVRDNPVSTLLEWAAKRHLTANFKESWQTSTSRFELTATLEDEPLVAVSSTSKKEAKRLAADRSLKVLAYTFTEDCKHLLEQSLNDVSIEMSSVNECTAPHIRGQVMYVINAHLPEEMRRQTGKKIYAAFYVHCSIERRIHVLSIGVGNKCIGSQYLTGDGTVIHDSHAQVLARRGLLRLMYGELLMLKTGEIREEASLFQIDDKSGKMTLRSSLTLHMYVSCGPCGDATAYVRTGVDECSADDDLSSNLDVCDNDDVITNHRPRMDKGGLLRSKIEKGEGTIPASGPALQTWDGLQRGERLHTMSCSDKLLKWNVCGIQGALLSRYYLPLYMKSLMVAGHLFDAGHLSRAVCCRCGDLDLSGISEGVTGGMWHVNHPLLIPVDREVVGEIGRSHSLALTWFLRAQHPHLIDSTMGNLVSTANPPCDSNENSPLVCKRELWSLFQRVIRLDAQDLGSSSSSSTYLDAKQECEEYNTVKKHLYLHLLNRGFGYWMQKPQQVDTFL